MNDNICKFVPVENSYDHINTVNFVYETVIPDRNRFITRSCYMMYLVTEGSGSLCHAQKNYEIKKGDLFFTFPAAPFAIQVDNSRLQYIYISFLGIRAGKILEELGIKSGNCVFHNYDSLQKFWLEALTIANQNNLAMLSESVLLYTLSMMSNNIETKAKISKTSNTSLQIKKYIDDNYTDSDLSLEKLCNMFQYNKKYLSCALKKVLQVGFSEYLRTLRIQHSCMLMNEGLSNVKDIAYLSGYKDPLYFSKVFKTIMNQSPKEYIASLKAEK